MTPLKSTTPPRTHAGHHTDQIIKLLQTPCASHPLAISIKSHARSLPEYQLIAQSATGGEATRWTRAANRRTARLSTVPFLSSSVLGATMLLSGIGRAKQSGEARSPTRSASEKLIVAHVDSVAPMKSRENDCMI